MTISCSISMNEVAIKDTSEEICQKLANFKGLEITSCRQKILFRRNGCSSQDAAVLKETL